MSISSTLLMLCWRKFVSSTILCWRKLVSRAATTWCLDFTNMMPKKKIEKLWREQIRKLYGNWCYEDKTKKEKGHLVLHQGFQCLPVHQHLRYHSYTSIQLFVCRHSVIWRPTWYFHLLCRIVLLFQTIFSSLKLPLYVKVIRSKERMEGLRQRNHWWSC